MALKFLKEYRYSSYLDFFQVKREENKILNIKVLPEYFEKPLDFENTLRDWLEYKV